MHPSPYDGKTYAYVGYVIGTVIRSVEFDSGQSDVTDTVTVATNTADQKSNCTWTTRMWNSFPSISMEQPTLVPSSLERPYTYPFRWWSASSARF